MTNTRWLLEYIRNDLYLQDIIIDVNDLVGTSDMTERKGILMKAFAEIVKELWSEYLLVGNRAINTVSFKNQMEKFASCFVGDEQQHAQEFLRYLLQGLPEDINRTIVDKLDNSKIFDISLGNYNLLLHATFVDISRRRW